jgi:hypothetical protein
MCSTHVDQWIDGRLAYPDPGPMTPEQRFWEKVDRRGDDECWEWTASRDPKGYGYVNTPPHRRAHRLSYALHNGTIPQGMQVMHSCDNPPCVNPAHLRLGTNLQNQEERKARRPWKGPRGGAHHKARLTEADVLAIRNDTRTGAALAKAYGVSQSSISSIRHRKSWTHV